MTPVAREGEPANIALAERMEGWIERQHILLIAAQENQHRADQRRLVLHDPDYITEYPINSYQQVVIISWYLSIKDHTKL